MATPYTGGPEGPDPRRDALIARRAEQRRRVRRRRLLAATALVLSLVTTIGVVALAGGGSGSSGPKPADNATARSGQKADHQARSSGLVRNATPQPSWKP